MFTYGVNGVTGDYFFKSKPYFQSQSQRGTEDEPLPDISDLRLALESQRPHLGLASGIDSCDLSKTGWGVIFPENVRSEVRDALKPLLELRRAMAGGLFRDAIYRRGQNKGDFLAQYGVGLGPADPQRMLDWHPTHDVKGMPYYLLIVGAPDEVPFDFQYELDVQYAVGRLHFDVIEHYAENARTVVASVTESARRPKTVSLFAPKNAGDEQTELSHDYLANPLMQRVLGTFKNQWRVESFFGCEASQRNLRGLLGGSCTPALLFTASHGLMFQDADNPKHRPHYGAIVCQDWHGPKRKSIKLEECFSARDVPSNATLHGLISFHFACCSAGIPSTFELDQVSRRESYMTHRPFVAELPKRLLSHPSGGALAFIGHVGEAAAFSFYDDRFGAQASAFESVIGHLMRGYPVGAAMEFMNQRHAELGVAYRERSREKHLRKRSMENELWKWRIAYMDARNYLVIGDPAVKLNVEHNS
jgi:hypothetical protein